MTMKRITVFIVTPCSLVEVYLRFGETYCLLSPPRW